MKYKIRIFKDGPDGPEPADLPDGYSIVAEEDPAGPWVSREFHDTVAGDRDELAGRLKAQHAVLDQALTELAWWFDMCVGPCEHEPGDRCFDKHDESDWCLSCRATSMMDISTTLGNALAPLIMTDEEQAAVREEAVQLPRKRHRPDEPGYVPRAMRSGDVLLCDECCNGDRECDDPSHWRRGSAAIDLDRCPFCDGKASAPKGDRFRIRAREVIPGDTLRCLNPLSMEGEVVEVIEEDVEKHLFLIRLTDDDMGKRSVHVSGEQLIVIEPKART